MHYIRTYLHFPTYNCYDCCSEARRQVMASSLWQVTVCDALDAMRKTGTLCDTTIVGVDGAVLYAHACVLTAASPSIAAYVRRTADGRYHVNIDWISGQSWDLLLRLLYCGAIDVDRDEEIEHVQALAKRLDIGVLVTTAAAQPRTKVEVSRSDAEFENVDAYDDPDVNRRDQLLTFGTVGCQYPPQDVAIRRASENRTYPPQDVAIRRAAENRSYPPQDVAIRRAAENRSYPPQDVAICHTAKNRSYPPQDVAICHAAKNRSYPPQDVAICHAAKNRSYPPQDVAMCHAAKNRTYPPQDVAIRRAAENRSYPPQDVAIRRAAENPSYTPQDVAICHASEIRTYPPQDVAIRRGSENRTYPPQDVAIWRAAENRSYPPQDVAICHASEIRTYPPQDVAIRRATENRSSTAAITKMQHRTDVRHFLRNGTSLCSVRVRPI